MVGVFKDFLLFFFHGLFRLVLDVIAFILSPLIFVFERIGSGKTKKYKSILITGGNSGLGESLALAFARPGVRLVLTARDINKLQNVKESCEKKGSEVIVESVDVRDKAAMEALIERVDNQQELDLVIANAGVSAETLGLKNVDEHIKPMFDINVEGVFNTIFPIIPRFRKRKNGQIALMSSAAGLFPLPSASSYSATKACIRYFGEALRPLLAVERVGVTVICPGFVRSQITEALLQKKIKLTGLMEAEEAALIMKDGLERNVGVIAYPFFTVLFGSFVNGLVSEVRDRVLWFMTPKRGAKHFFKDS